MSEKIFIFKITFVIERFINNNVLYQRYINAVLKHCDKKLSKFLNHHRFIICNNRYHRQIHIL